MINKWIDQFKVEKLGKKTKKSFLIFGEKLWKSSN